MTEIKTMKCNYCGKEFHVSESTYENGEFIHTACYSEYENDTNDTLEDTIIKRFLAKEGCFHSYFGEHYVSDEKHFNKHNENHCHWVKIYDLNKDATVRDFTSTFSTDELSQVISAKADCACGEYEGEEIITRFTIPELINFAIKEGLVNDI